MADCFIVVGGGARKETLAEAFIGVWGDFALVRLGVDVALIRLVADCSCAVGLTASVVF